MTVRAAETIETDAPLPTWFGVGGRADHLARPRSVEEVAELRRAFPELRVLGDGANLLVDDGGVDGLVITLNLLDDVEWPDAPEPGQRALVIAGAGCNLPRLLLECGRRGLAGLEGLGGIPASVGGAAIMNAGGAFGAFADAVAWIEGVDPAGERRRIPRADIAYDYRASGLDDLVITEVALALDVVPATGRMALRERLKEVMAYKKSTQPLAAHSAGCVFRNPVIDGARISAGLLIDQAGCKGLTRGGARVSDHHANFIVTQPGCRAADIIALIDLVRAAVARHHAVDLQREVVVWSRSR